MEKDRILAANPVAFFVLDSGLPFTLFYATQLTLQTIVGGPYA